MKMFYAILAVVALILAIGTAGALENESIGLGQAIIQSAIFGGLCWLSFKKLDA